jgi:hypothetical protein
LLFVVVALSGTVFIDRANKKTAIAAFDGAVKEIKGNRQSVWIFPVGPVLAGVVGLWWLTWHRRALGRILASLICSRSRRARSI